MLPQLFLLLLREILRIVRLTFERQWVEWILWMFLVEDVSLSVSPIWEIFHVWWLSKNRFALVIEALNWLLLRYDSKVLVCVIWSRSHVHSMWINDLCLFFKVEWLAFFEHNRLFQLVIVVLLIAWWKSFGIWIANKFISATSLPSSLISADGVALDRNWWFIEVLWAFLCI